MTTVRAERPGDVRAVREVNEAAFETPAEARLVDLLRERERLLVSLVAEKEGEIIGHIAFSRARIESRLSLPGFGLGPMAVIPARQGLGVGSQLVRAGLAQCRELGAAFVVVLGHPHYYPRFGFLSASRFGLSCRWPAPEGVFMATEVEPGSLAGGGGLVSYEPEFDEV